MSSPSILQEMPGLFHHLICLFPPDVWKSSLLKVRYIRWEKLTATIGFLSPIEKFSWSKNFVTHMLYCFMWPRAIRVRRMAILMFLPQQNAEETCKMSFCVWSGQCSCSKRSCFSTLLVFKNVCLYCCSNTALCVQVNQPFRIIKICIMKLDTPVNKNSRFTSFQFWSRNEIIIEVGILLQIAFIVQYRHDGPNVCDSVSMPNQQKCFLTWASAVLRSRAPPFCNMHLRVFLTLKASLHQGPATNSSSFPSCLHLFWTSPLLCTFSGCCDTLRFLGASYRLRFVVVHTR